MASVTKPHTGMYLSLFGILLLLALLWLLVGSWILDTFLHSTAGRGLAKWLGGLPPEARPFAEVILSALWSVAIGLVSLVGLVRAWGRKRKDIEQQYDKRMEDAITAQRAASDRHNSGNDES